MASAKTEVYVVCIEYYCFKEKKTPKRYKIFNYYIRIICK